MNVRKIKNCFGKNNNFYGHQHTEETKEKNRQKLLKKWQTVEYKEKQRVAHIGKYGHNKGKSWKIKDTSNMNKDKIGKPSGALGKNWKISKPRTKQQKENYRQARLKQVFLNKDTSIEIKMQNELKKRNIQFIKQKLLLKKYIVDIFIKPNIVIECDGDYWHSRPETIKSDKIRNKKLRKNGFAVYRFWEHAINRSSSECVNEIFK